MLGEITPAGREHFLGKIEDTHAAFKSFVAERRPDANLAKVANGDVWLASEAVSLGLVDALSTGDDLLFRLKDQAHLFEVATAARKTLLQQLLGGLGFEGSSASGHLARLPKRSSEFVTIDGDPMTFNKRLFMLTIAPCNDRLGTIGFAHAATRTGGCPSFRASRRADDLLSRAKP